MALNINTNIGALGAAASASSAAKSMESAMERLSTGLRINTAADDAAGVSISTRMEAQIRGINQAIRNAGDGQALADTAEGAMTEITNMLQRMRELSVQASNDTYNLQDRTNLNSEVNQLKAEIDRIAASSTFNGQKLLDGSFASRTLQIGNEATQQLTFSIGNMSTTALGTTAVNSGVSGVTSNVAQGTQAVKTVSQMAFNGNDSYGFTLTLGDGAKGTDVLTIAGASVVGGSATDVADKINSAISTAVANNTMSAGAAVARANGNVVTIENSLGDSINVSAFTSAGNGTVSYASISGAGNSLLLNDAVATKSTTNSGGGTATKASSSLALQAGKDYSFNINGTNISVTKLGTTTTEANLLAQLKLAIGDGAAGSQVVGQTFSLEDTTGKNIEIKNFVASSSPAGSAGSMVMTVRVDTDKSTASNTFAVGGSDTSAIDKGDIVQLSFTEAEADYGFKLGGAAYTVATASANKSLQEALAVTRDAINLVGGDATARVVDGKLEIEIAAAAAAAVTLDTFTSTGKATVVAGTASFATVDLTAQGSASTTNGVLAVASQTTMDFSQDDTYSFKIGGTLVTAQIAGGSLENMVSAVNSQSATTGVTAVISNGDLLLTKAAGGAINITDFASVGTGIANVAHAAGQGSSVTLTDTAATTGATTAAAGIAANTVMDLSLSSKDAVTFKIADGRTNAVVRLTTWDPAANTAMLTEINSALSNAGSDIVASTTGVGAAITLTNSKGGRIEITNFTSDSTGVMTATPASGQGVGKLLNDDGISGSQAAVSAVSVLDQASANAAVATIDRAFEQVNAQRSELGAISNRLDHTISNLTNISINTESAKSRIMDADFAAESTSLAKAQILQQASMAMLAQANASKQGVLSLLQG